MASAAEQMRAKLALADAAIERARAKWTGTGVAISSWLGISPQTSQLAAIDNLKRAVTTQRDALEAIVRNHETTNQRKLTAWLDAVNTAYVSASQIAEDAQTGDLGSIVADVAVQTARQAPVVIARNIGEVTAAAAKPLLPVVVPLLVIIAIAAAGVVIAKRSGVL